MGSQALVDYRNQMRGWAQGCCVPVFYRDDTFRLHNGSMTFVDTGTEILGITAGHVADDIIKYCDGSPGHGCQVGCADLAPDRLVARHPKLDLATFRLSAPFVTAGNGHSVTVPSWPPRAPRVGEQVLFCGYPGIYREEKDGQYATAFLYFGGLVESVSDRNFGMVLRIASAYDRGHERVPANADLGGWSGGAVFRVVENETLARLEFAGIIYEYSPVWGIVLAHPVSCVAPDGAFVMD